MGFELAHGVIHKDNKKSTHAPSLLYFCVGSDVFMTLLTYRSAAATIPLYLNTLVAQNPSFEVIAPYISTIVHNGSSDVATSIVVSVLAAPLARTPTPTETGISLSFLAR